MEVFDDEREEEQEDDEDEEQSEAFDSSDWDPKPLQR